MCRRIQVAESDHGQILRHLRSAACRFRKHPLRERIRAADKNLRRASLQDRRRPFAPHLQRGWSVTYFKRNVVNIVTLQLVNKAVGAAKRERIVDRQNTETSIALFNQMPCKLLP